MTTPPSPEELAQAHGLPPVRALIDLDLGGPSPQVMENPHGGESLRRHPIRKSRGG